MKKVLIDTNVVIDYLCERLIAIRFACLVAKHTWSSVSALPTLLHRPIISEF
ncbi:MAG: hypothetical protein FWH18_12495 [Marinilabiliaceae bacterium]|nr:hypothetical protein [Marinilabiliaceae bacterium]